MFGTKVRPDLLRAGVDSSAVGAGAASGAACGEEGGVSKSASGEEGGVSKLSSGGEGVCGSGDSC